VGYLIFKALHVIFVVTWFAALFYIVRLFIYSTESAEREAGAVREALLDQLAVMQRRLWFGIAWPSAILTLILGGILFAYYAFIFAAPLPVWLLTKLGFVIFLYGYHLACHKIYKQETARIFKYSSLQLRVWNEVATLFLVAIVFAVILKDALDPLSLILSSLAFTALLIFSVVRLAARKKNTVPHQ